MIKKKKFHLSIYFLLRFIVVVTMIRQIMIQNWSSVFICILTLILFFIPSIFERRMGITLPKVLEAIILLFIFAAEILGEIMNFYGTVPHWDTMLHTVNGFLAAAIGFSLVDILNQNKRFTFKLSPLFVVLVGFCFSMTIGVMWEFIEFGADQILNLDMQKDRVVQKISTVELEPEGRNIPVVVDNIKRTEIYSLDESGQEIMTTIDGGYLDVGVIDTMKDLIVNFIGAIIFSVFGFFYLKNREKYKFAGKFIPIKNDPVFIEEKSE
ncbi:hypothetical protein [Vagococcus silagei]|uniref:Uncharacterized protein n=1 Tax=Vagococcus silagei TaxID=2508885 RepID=A0A4S3B4K5_9ENTE|nr:hypothetical protein [Vagococcus silagei]THB60730.1 hypothetical protein ESZ54_09075 [Vagococcus silagei]